jgi:hydroxypyruvate reductase/glycerate 2-kinase
VAATLSQRDEARLIWQAGVDAVQPEKLLRTALANPLLRDALESARRIIVVGAGKAGATMSAAVENLLPGLISKMVGLVNVPAEAVRPLRSIQLHAARPSAFNHPTEAGVEGARKILTLLDQAKADDVALCLISGGGSALLPAPVEGISLEDKQAITQLLHSCGATIGEMNCVRKHLSKTKGGRLAQAFKGRAFFSLIISDVIGDPLDVIASGPTAVDPSTFADALAVLAKFRLLDQAPSSIVDFLRRGARGETPETLKRLPDHVYNWIVGNNQMALKGAQEQAERLGYRVLNLGSFIEGETREVAGVHAGILRSIKADQIPINCPACLLSGGETTVTLVGDHGLGGRNQEYVLASLTKLGELGMKTTTILSGGTDGEDGPTDAAGAIADADTLRRANATGLNAAEYLHGHDAYSYFAATGSLLKTGLTGTNVMDIRVSLVA